MCGAHAQLRARRRQDGLSNLPSTALSEGYTGTDVTYLQDLVQEFEEMESVHVSVAELEPATVAAAEIARL